MIRNIALTLALVVASHMCLANPVPEPEPFGGHHKTTHIRIHVPYDVHTVHHHHVEHVPILKEIPVIKEVPIIKPVPIVKHVPIVNTVHVPVLNTVHVEKPVLIPYKESISYWH